MACPRLLEEIASLCNGLVFMMQQVGMNSPKKNKLNGCLLAIRQMNGAEKIFMKVILSNGGVLVAKRMLRSMGLYPMFSTKAASESNGRMIWNQIGLSTGIIRLSIPSHDCSKQHSPKFISFI